ncbi:MAG: TIGR03960 family B12-binding radical SAM protein [Saccharofermentanales bacterium]
MTTVTIPRHVLLSVQKPARYTGGELNSIIKAVDDKMSRFAFCFPDTYEIGMSHLGMKILYHMLNERNDTYCERCYMPWTDMQALMKESGLPLFSIETRTPLHEFDIVGFTLQYEMCYSNVLHMLDMGRIPIHSAERGSGDPLVIAGGPCAFNIEPMAEFFDAVFIGESEEQLSLFMDLYSKTKRSGVFSREEFLLRAAKDIPGLYVPAFFDVAYNDDGTVRSIQPNREGIPSIVKKAIVMDPNKAYYPRRFIVPNTEVVHDRVSLELFRGCTRGCRFCQAGFITRPVRERTPQNLLDIALEAQAATGYDEIGLLSLSTGDYTGFRDLTVPLMHGLENSHASLSLPSMRVDSFTLDIMEQASATRKSGLTFAPEAGSQRLRNVINKNISEGDLAESMRLAYEGGWNGAKLYFMMGLPTETMEDVAGIAELAREMEHLYFTIPADKRKRKLELTVSTAMFIPKPFTPFQWEPQDTIESLSSKQQQLRDMLRSRFIKFQWHGSRSSLWEAVLARGDRRLGNVIYKAFRQGCVFDAWDDHFNFDLYIRCMEEEELNVEFYANRQRPFEEVFPWDHIDCGVSKQYLMEENIKAHSEIVTPECRTECSSCGAACFGGGVCFE